MWELLPNQKIDQPLGVVLVWPGATQLQPCNPSEIDLELLYWALTCGHCRCPTSQSFESFLHLFIFSFCCCLNAQTESEMKQNFTDWKKYVCKGKSVINSEDDLGAERFLNDRCILCFKWYEAVLRREGGL